MADFQKLQEAKEVLCNETKRKNYDLWKRSGVTISFHDWQALNDSVKTVRNVLGIDVFQNKSSAKQKIPVIYIVTCLQSMHWAVRDKKEPMLEASKAEILVTCQTEDLYSEQGAPGDSSCGAMPSSSKNISKYWKGYIKKVIV